MMEKIFGFMKENPCVGFEMTLRDGCFVVAVGCDSDVRIAGVGTNLKAAIEDLAAQMDKIDGLVYEEACRQYEVGNWEVDEALHQMRHIEPALRGAVSLLQQTVA